MLFFALSLGLQRADEVSFVATEAVPAMARVCSIDFPSSDV